MIWDRKFSKFKKKKHLNSLVSYLNINSLINKIIVLRETVKYLELDHFIIIETKIDENFPSVICHLQFWDYG